MGHEGVVLRAEIGDGTGGGGHGFPLWEGASYQETVFDDADAHQGGKGEREEDGPGVEGQEGRGGFWLSGHEDGS